jgi:hypothetical protein
MPAVKDVGEPGAGEPHARFDEAAGGIWCQSGSLCRTALAPPADPTLTPQTGAAVWLTQTHTAVRRHTPDSGTPARPPTAPPEGCRPPPNEENGKRPRRRVEPRIVIAAPEGSPWGPSPGRQSLGRPSGSTRALRGHRSARSFAQAVAGARSGRRGQRGADEGEHCGVDLPLNLRELGPVVRMEAPSLSRGSSSAWSIPHSTQKA